MLGLFDTNGYFMQKRGRFFTNYGIKNEEKHIHLFEKRLRDLAEFDIINKIIISLDDTGHSGGGNDE